MTQPPPSALPPPEACADMASLRAAIDALDGQVVDLLVQRADYIDRAAVLKKGNGLPANIPARVEEVITRVRSRAGQAGLDPDLVETMWRAMIQWSITREEQYLGRTGPAKGG